MVRGIREEGMNLLGFFRSEKRTEKGMYCGTKSERKDYLDL